MKKTIEFIQKELKKKGLYHGEADGIAGSGTIGALAMVPGLDKGWSLKRRIIGCIQLLCQENGINPGSIDGYWGHNTENAYDEYIYLLAHGTPPEPWRPEGLPDKNPNVWPRQYTNVFSDTYGQRGQHLVRIELPYPHKLAWNTTRTINSYYCHKKVKDSLGRILKKVVDNYGMDDIRKLRLDLWGGCYNERQIRGGSKWSMHSWAIAIDYDPARNKLKWGRDRATFARPEYDKWWELWEAEGWVSLGRQRNFDWMHIQAAKI